MSYTITKLRHLFLTGASGFVGSAALRHVMQNTDWVVTCPVSMRHHGQQDRLFYLKGMEKYRDRINIVPCDLSMPFGRSLFTKFGDIDYVWNIASESHVDRALVDPAPFIKNNVDLMVNVLEFAREVKPALFLHMSTDEVFGPLYDGDDPHREWSTIKPSNPYSASKAAQEAIAFSYWRAFGVPVVMTNTMNLIGPAQHAEKFIPKVIKALHEGETITVHSSEDGKSGSRCWISVDEFASAWLYLTRELTAAAETGVMSLTYYPDMPQQLHRWNIVGHHATNLWIADTIADIMGVTEPDIQMVNFHTSRPGHDMHYGLNGTKLRAFGWSPREGLRQTLQKIVDWYVIQNPQYLDLT